jgi:broad specificity phosphatase PhoE
MTGSRPTDAGPPETGSTETGQAQPERPRSAIDEAFLTGDPGAGELILVRHGEQDFPADWTAGAADFVDPPLSPRGRRQAEAVGRALAGRPVEAVYASTLERARHTGEAIAAHHGLGVTTVGDLREIEMFRGLPDGVSLVDALGADALRAGRARFVATRRWESYPATESGAELRDRVVPAVEAIVADHPGGVVAVACHGGVINAYIAHVLGLVRPDDPDMVFRPAHASVHRVAYAGERRIIGSLNAIDHLIPADELLSW